MNSVFGAPARSSDQRRVGLAPVAFFPQSLASVGVGLRWFWKGYVGLSFDVAYVLEGNNRRFGDEITRADTVDYHANLFVRY